LKTPNFFRRLHSNIRGQVAIFVALIFQIIFVLFAMVVNVGLLVHHKINLQHSTDLSAYYGAMKQADLLNVVAHMNFQIRQSWKLFSWRYRVVGTFGYIPVPSSPQPSGVPIQIGSSGNSSTISYNAGTAGTRCTLSNGELGVTDLAPFCVGHSGFGDTNTSATSWESSCRASCQQVSGAAAVIANINAGAIPNTVVPGSGNVSSAISSMLQLANQTGAELCAKGTTLNLTQLVNFVTAYVVDMENRTQSAQLIMGSLLANADSMVDLDGKKVFDGAKKTLENNLTEANRSSLGNNFKFFNSTSGDNSAANGCDQRENVFNELKYQFIQLLVSFCEGTPANMRNDKFLSVFNADRTLKTELVPFAGGQAQVIQDVFNNQFKIGFEKNPWCQNYFGARATTEPRIPFLPLAKIKLHATAFAKPFGGSIGPWYHKLWNRQESSSSSLSGQTDLTLPPLRVSQNANPPLSELVRILPNHGLFVGDSEGLRNPHVVAAYHDLLLTRNTTLGSQGSSYATNSRVQSFPAFSGALQKPTSGWPYLKNWNNATDLAVASYDPLALVDGQNSGLRDMEIAAVAPNQFDLSYYSIDSDFYNNYYRNRLGEPNVVSAFKALSNFSGNVQIRPDLGWNATLAQSGAIPIEYSVRHQLAVVEQSLRGGETGSGISQLRASGIQTGTVIDRFFTYIPRFQGSLLTGWTLRDLAQPDGYTDFPSDPNNTTMPFGRCKDDFQSSNTPNYQSLVDQAGSPPSTGNCVTGGRTGYSVKLVSPNFINYEQQGELGGTGTGGQGIRNQIPPDFFNF